MNLTRYIDAIRSNKASDTTKQHGNKLFGY